jgi:dimethylglycine dehydrogenase
VTLQVQTIDADAYMNEGVYSGEKLVGRITSGVSSHIVGGCLSMAYLDVEYADIGTELTVLLLDNRCAARVIADSPYDPTNERLRG